MDYKSLNEKLKDLDALRNTKVEKLQIEDYESEWHEICPFEGNTFIRLRIRVDSYGENEWIVGVEFVKPKQVTATNYKSI